MAYPNMFGNKTEREEYRKVFMTPKNIQRPVGKKIDYHSNN